MKLLLALFVGTYFGYSMAYDSDSKTDAELNNIVLKYKYLAQGNAEFSQWVEKIYYKSIKSGDYEGKKSMLRNFKEYDAARQRGEDQLRARIHELESLLMNNDLSLECRSDYLTQKDVLTKAFQFSNEKKRYILNENSRKCTKQKEKPVEEYDYWTNWWNWLFG